MEKNFLKRIREAQFIRIIYYDHLSVTEDFWTPQNMEIASKRFSGEVCRTPHIFWNVVASRRTLQGLSSCSFFRNLGEKTRLGRGWGTGIGGNPELFLKLTSVFWQRPLVWARCKRQAPWGQGFLYIISITVTRVPWVGGIPWHLVRIVLIKWWSYQPSVT